MEHCWRRCRSGGVALQPELCASDLQNDRRGSIWKAGQCRREQLRLLKRDVTLEAQPPQPARCCTREAARRFANGQARPAPRLAAVSAVKPSTLSGLIRRLVSAGELHKRALPTGHTGYAIADTLPRYPATQDPPTPGHRALRPRPYAACPHPT